MGLGTHDKVPRNQIKNTARKGTKFMTTPKIDQANTESSVQNAGFWRRFFAFGLDSLILILLGTVIITLRAELNHPEYWQKTELIRMLLRSLYFVVMWVNFNGQTIGKKVFGIKIVTVDGKPLGYGKAILRAIGYEISALPLFLGLLWVAWDKDKRGWHDKIAGTKVIVTDPRPKTVQTILVIIASSIVVTAISGISILPSLSSAFNRDINSKTEFRKDFDTSNQLNSVPQSNQGNDRDIEYRIQVNPQDEQGNYHNVKYYIEINQNETITP